MEALFVNIIAAVVIVLAFGAAVFYLYRQRKKGVKCIGCPSGGGCQKKPSCPHCQGAEG